MAIKRIKRRASRKRRRKNPYASVRVRKSGPKRRRKVHKVRVYKVGRGKNAKLYRSPRYRLKPRRVNRRRRRSNPFAIKQYFGQRKLMRALTMLGGIGVAAFAKKFVTDMLPANMQEIGKRGYGLLSIVAGSMVANKSRRAATKNIAHGMIAFGVYDLIASNAPVSISKYLPKIAPPMLGAMNYGRSIYGASIQSGPVEIVGANISAGSAAEIVGEDMDLADSLEMSI